MDSDQAHRLLEVSRVVETDLRLSFSRIEKEHDDLKTAAVWLVRSGEPSEGLELAANLWGFWYELGYVRDGERFLDQLFAEPATQRPTSGLAMACYARGELAFRQGQNQVATGFFERALSLSEKLGPWQTSNRALCGLARTALREHDFDSVERLATAAHLLAQERKSRDLEWSPQHMLAATARMRGQYAVARDLYQRSIALATELGTLDRVAVELHNLGYVELHAGDIPKAKAHFREALELARRDDQTLMLCYAVLDGAVTAMADEDLYSAAVLEVAARTVFAARGTVPDPDDQAELEATATRLRRDADAGMLERASAQGAALDLESAVGRALEVFGR